MLVYVSMNGGRDAFSCVDVHVSWARCAFTAFVEDYTWATLLLLLLQLLLLLLQVG
jgi:hypothetical protein